ncbi:MAG TPA: DinB family protein [Anaerolineaceae bacterium]
MLDLSLFDAVDNFTKAALAQTDPDLERPWAWGVFDSEDVRFAYFRTYEELRTLAVLTSAERDINRTAPTSARRILAQFHAAYRDLQAVLLRVDAATAERSPAEGEWSVRQALGHMVRADARFLAAVRHALDHHRAGDWNPGPIPPEVYPAVIGLVETEFDAILSGPLDKIQAYHAALHARILLDLDDITEEELELPVIYRENRPTPLRFRLHRFDSHLRQHIVQVEKTLAVVGKPQDEIHRLLRLIYAGLAEAEGAAFKAGEEVGGHWHETARQIAAWAKDIDFKGVLEQK